MGARAVGPSPWRRRRRVLIEDSRHNGTYLRTTWHPEGRTFVISVWNEDVCTSAVRVPVEQSPELINLLVDGLSDAAGGPGTASGGQGVPPPPPPNPSAGTGALITARHQLQGWANWAAQRARDLLASSLGGPPKPPSAQPPDLPAESPDIRRNGNDRNGHDTRQSA
jgi:hypothetical protein